jgi:hypothetical protein
MHERERKKRPTAPRTMKTAIPIDVAVARWDGGGEAVGEELDDSVVGEDWLLGAGSAGCVDETRRVDELLREATHRHGGKEVSQTRLKTRRAGGV